MRWIRIYIMFSLCIILIACGSNQQNDSFGELGINETKSLDVTGTSITEEEANITSSSLKAKAKEEKKNGKRKKYEEGKNPIDENKYFRPLFETDYKGTENERRAMMVRYYFAWKEEYENVIKWLSDKCRYEEDKNDILQYNMSVAECIEENSDSLLKTMILDCYEDEPEERLKGLSTDSRIRYQQGKMYRGICLSLIESVSDYAVQYTFLEKDYSEIFIG